jgi:hypothetical protein
MPSPSTIFLPAIFSVRASQRNLATLSFDAAGFGHGGPIVRDALARFRDQWREKSPG